MDSNSGFTWTDFETLRHSHLSTMGIYLSSSCPVHCAHCGVSASPYLVEKPTNTYFTFVEQMCRIPELVAVAITGGEPFFELDLLGSLVEIFFHAGKRIVVYTSGYWGKADIGSRALPLLASIDGLIFGVDLYHRAHIPDEDLINALRCAAERGVWTTAQVLDGVDDNVHSEYATSIFKKAFGPEWERFAKIARIHPLPSGRARKIEAFKQYRETAEEYCDGINGPTLLRDGTLAACCNEEVVLQKGPGVFRVEHQDSLYRSLEMLENRPVLNYLQKLPPVTLWSLALQCVDPENPIQRALLCKACWKFAGIFASMNGSQKRKFDAMVNFLTTGRVRKQDYQPLKSHTYPVGSTQDVNV